MSSEELMEYYDDYCRRYKIDKKDPKNSGIWWAMFYTWKDCGEGKAGRDPADHGGADRAQSDITGL